MDVIDAINPAINVVNNYFSRKSVRNIMMSGVIGCPEYDEILYILAPHEQAIRLEVGPISIHYSIWKLQYVFEKRAIK